MELAELQDAEVGDGTTSVVILAAELLKRANELVRNKIHPTSIISGYRLAMREVRGVAKLAGGACGSWGGAGRARGARRGEQPRQAPLLEPKQPMSSGATSSRCGCG